MTIMKTLAAAAAATLITGSAVAGGFATIIEEPVVVTPADTGSLPGWVIPVVIVAALIGVASTSDDESGTASGGTGD